MESDGEGGGIVVVSMYERLVEEKGKDITE